MSCGSSTTVTSYHIEPAHHAYIIAVQQYLWQPSLSTSVVELNHILQHHVDVVIEAEQRARELFVTFHHDPDSAVDAFVDQFCGRLVKRRGDRELRHGGMSVTRTHGNAFEG